MVFRGWTVEELLFNEEPKNEIALEWSAFCQKKKEQERIDKEANRFLTDLSKFSWK